MSDDLIQVREGRLFVQMAELTPYDLVDCSGLTDWGRPRGGITPIRTQSLTKIGEEDVAGYQRASRDMAGFTIQSRLREIANFLITLNCETNWQVLFKDCGDPGNYYGFKYALAWQKCPAGDLAGEALAIIEGDNVPINVTNPFMAVYGPYLVDFTVKFLSRRDIAETGSITDIAMFEEECLEDCLFQAGAGQYGYAVATAQAGSPVDAASVWWTNDYADTWALCSQAPFGAGVDVSSVVKVGTVMDHRVIVSRGEAVGVEPAQIAYADVTTIGQTPWVNVNVGAVASEYITRLCWPVYSKLFAITNLGNIYKSVDGGATWTNIYNDAADTYLADISLNKKGYGWVVGNSGLALYTFEWGNSWTVEDCPNETNPAVNLTTVHVDFGRKVSIGDATGNIFSSADEGATDWVITPAQGITATNIRLIRGFHNHWKWVIVDIAATPPNVGNSRVLRSTDGGATWHLWPGLTQNLVPNNGLLAMYCVDVNRVVVAGNPYPNGGTAFLTRTETNVDRIVS